MREAFEIVLMILLLCIVGLNPLKTWEVLSHSQRCKLVVIRWHLKRVFGITAALGLLLLTANQQGWDFFISFLLLCMAFEFIRAPWD